MSQQRTARYYGESEAACLEQLGEAWKRHAAQVGDEPTYFEDVKDEVNVIELPVGVVLRDWEPV